MSSSVRKPLLIFKLSNDVVLVLCSLNVVSDSEYAFVRCTVNFQKFSNASGIR